MNFNKLDNLISNIDVLGIPNCDCAVTYKHETVYRKIVGYTDIAKTRPASEDDIYYLYSASKLALAVAAMQLVEDGRLSLTDPVSKYFPGYGKYVKCGDSIIPAKTGATIEQMLSMQGGLNYDLNRTDIAELLQRNPKASTQEIIRQYIEAPLEFEPGSQFLYSMCLDVMGAVIEQITGERYSDYIKNHIADPLGWKVCAFHPTPELEEHMPQQYLYNANAQSAAYAQSLIPMPNTNVAVFGENYDSAGGGLLTRVSDYMLLTDALANDGVGKNGVKILSRASIDNMRRDRLITPEKINQHAIHMWDFGYGYGLGVRTMVDNRLAESPIGEFGWDGLGGAFLLCDVENNISITYLMSIPGILHVKQSVHNKLRDYTYEALRDELNK